MLLPNAFLGDRGRRERVSKEAIAESVRLASQAFQDHAGQYVRRGVCTTTPALRYGVRLYRRPSSSQTCSLVQIQSGFQSISEVFHKVWRWRADSSG